MSGPTFQLDTSGCVTINRFDAANYVSQPDAYRWSDLSPFAQGYVEALFADVGAGTRDQWGPGETAVFEYHCFEDDDSSDAELWRRSRRLVTVLGVDDEPPCADTLNERGAAGMPLTYRVRFGDGHEADVWEDELLASRLHFSDAYTPGGDLAECLAKPAFSDLAPATLAKIVEDCEKLAPHFGRRLYTNSRGDGRLFWKNRQGPGVLLHFGMRFPALTPSLGDDGLIYLREAAQ